MCFQWLKDITHVYLSIILVFVFKGFQCYFALITLKSRKGMLDLCFSRPLEITT